ncbi:MAG: tyrosine-type recombinase/integrase [Spirochaetota bacterium]
MLFAEEHINAIWANPYHYAANLLSAWTGMRMGEVQALMRKYVFQHHIEIVHSWNDRYGLSIPKWNSVRIVPIPGRVSTALTTILDMNPYQEPKTLVFAASQPDKPLSKTALLKQYRRALRNIGISETAQKARGLCFHSWRHGLNSLMRGQVADEMIRRVLGHKTPMMTENYDHVTPEMLAPILKAQEKLFAEKK